MKNAQQRQLGFGCVDSPSMSAIAAEIDEKDRKRLLPIQAITWGETLQVEPAGPIVHMGDMFA